MAISSLGYFLTVAGSPGMQEQFSLLFLALLVLAYPVIAVGTWGQTLGKALVGIKVVREDGELPSYGAALLRAVIVAIPGFIAFVSIMFSMLAVAFGGRPEPLAFGLLGSLLMFTDYGWAFFNKNRQTWHDLAARTFVVTIHR